MAADLKFALRTLRSTPGLTAVAVVCLAFAIGLTTAVFSVVQSAFFTPLPLPGGDRLVIVQDYQKLGGHNVALSAEDYTTRRERAQSFEDVAAWYSRNVTIAAGDGTPTVVRAAYVSPNALSLARIPPAQGRLPNDADVAPGAEPVVVLGHHVFRDRIGNLEDAGQTVQIGGRAHRVIGVLPEGVRFPMREDAWIPVQVDARQGNATPEGLTFFGRLRPGVTPERAAAELSTIPTAGDANDPRTATTPVAMPFTRGFMSREGEMAVYALLAGLVLFLIVIASNLANLFLAKNSARLREVAVRASLGATLRQLIRPFLLETLLIGSAAAAGGLVIARVAVDWFIRNAPDVPWWADFSLNLPLLAVLVGATVIGSAAAGAGPAFRVTRVSAGDVLKSMAPGAGGLRFSRIGALLLILQFSVSVGSLSVVAILARSMYGFSFQQYRIDGSGVLVAQVYMGAPDAAELNAAGADRLAVYQRHFARSHEQFERIRTGLAAEPGTVTATFSTHFPGNDVESVEIDVSGASGAPARETTRIAEVGPDFLGTLGTSVILGRDFSEAERTGPMRTAIVNAPFAAKHFPRRSPIGSLIRVVDERTAQAGPWLEVVGVVPDLGLNPGDQARADGIYVPFSPSSFTRFAIRTAGDPAALIPAVHRLVGRENPRAQVQSTQTLERQMREAESVFRGLGTGLVALGGTALLLSAVSFYSLVAFGVTRRTREIGLRLALGATGARIVTGVLRREMFVMAAGALGGVVAGGGLYQLVRQIPFDLSPATPAFLAVPASVILIVGVGACIAPVRRALKIDPALALRRD